MDQFVVSTEMDTITITQLTLTQTAEATTPLVAVEMVRAALTQLNRKQLQDVWQVVQFLDYKASVAEDIAEDEALWAAVQAHETYKAQHPDEQPEIYRTKEELAKALVDL